MPVTDQIELKRLILQIERDRVAQASLKTMLCAADATVVGHQQQLRTVKARIRRHSAKPPVVRLG